MSRWRALVAVFLLLTAGSMALGQREGEKSQGQLGFFGLRGMMGSGALTDTWAALLRTEQVRKELEISAEQFDKLKEIARKATERVRRDFAAMQRLRDAGPEERKAKFAELAKKARTQAEETKKEIEGVLRPHQITRLQQIALQVRGAAALDDKRVQAELKLADEQKSRLKSLRENAGEALRGAGRAASEADRKARREKLEAARKELEQKRLGVLSAEQREKFERMKGPKFDLDTTQLRPRGQRTR